MAAFGGIGFRVGEQVVIRRNFQNHADRSIRVTNGQSGVITALDGDSVSIQLDTTSSSNDSSTTPGPVVRLDQDYIAAGGRLTHGYAYTTHRTQGGTWDASLAVGLDGLYREGAYTALSRGREGNVLLMTDPEMRLLETERAADPPSHGTGIRLPSEEPPTAAEQVAQRVSQRRGKQLAMDLDPEINTVKQLAQQYSYPELVSLSARAVQVERVATDQVGMSNTTIAERLDQVRDLAHSLAPRVKVKALDRNNIGTITTLNPAAGTASVRFQSAHGQQAVRTMPWDALEIIDPAAPEQPLTPETQAWLNTRTSELEGSQTRWHEIVTDLGSKPDAATLFGRATKLVLDRASNHLAATVPRWLEHSLGARPVMPEGATTWDSVVTDITAYRLQHELSRDVHGIGPRPHEPQIAVAWDRVNTRIGDTHAWLLNHPDHAEPQWPILPSRPALVERRTVLSGILGTAPPDQRTTINRLLAGQLGLGDATKLLTDAQATQQQRRAWILEHWPHVVEAAEISTAFENGRFGPDTDVLMDDIGARSTNPNLILAVESREPWLAAALNAVTHPIDDSIDRPTMTLFEAIADFRIEHAIIHRDPLGPLSSEPERFTQSVRLLNRLDELHIGPTLEPPTAAIDEVGTVETEVDGMERLELDREHPDLDDEIPMIER